MASFREFTSEKAQAKLAQLGVIYVMQLGRGVMQGASVLTYLQRSFSFHTKFRRAIKVNTAVG